MPRLPRAPWGARPLLASGKRKAQRKRRPAQHDAPRQAGCIHGSISRWRCRQGELSEPLGVRETHTSKPIAPTLEQSERC